MKKPKYSFIFVVLTYRNTDDLESFFKANKVKNSKTIVVNSFYDDKSKSEFEKIAKENNADFLNVPNNGYGAGNNRGIEYALEHYDFDYLIISNADIEIEKFDKHIIDKHSDCIIAPKILTLKGKNQNPSSAFKQSKIYSKLKYYFYKNNHNFLIWLCYIYSRLSKILYYLISKWRKNIYAPHGAFIIIPKNILLKIIPIFNEDMFLFYEETHIGNKMNQLKLKTTYCPEIVIRHKEDGSVSLLSEKLFNLSADSYIKLYNYWYKKSN